MDYIKADSKSRKSLKRYVSQGKGASKYLWKAENTMLEKFKEQGGPFASLEQIYYHIQSKVDSKTLIN